MEDQVCIAAISGHIENCIADEREKIENEEELLELVRLMNQCAHFETGNRNHKVRIIYNWDNDDIKYYECDSRRFWVVGPIIVETPTSVKSINQGGGGSLE